MTKMCDYLYYGQNRMFVIPPYQRQYDWDNKNNSDFLSSVVKAIDRPAPYSVGYMVFNNQKDDAVDIVEGQQRNLSLSLLLKAILDCSNVSDDTRDKIERIIYCDKTSKIPRIKVKIADRTIYNNILSGRTLTDEEYNSKLYKGYKFFCNEIKNRDIGDVEKIFEGILNLAITPEYLTEYDDPIEIYLDHNKTGKEASAYDMVRSYFLHLDEADVGSYVIKEIERTLHNIDDIIKNENHRKKFLELFVGLHNLKNEGSSTYDTFKIIFPFKDLSERLEVLDEYYKYAELYEEIYISRTYNKNGLNNTIFEILDDSVFPFIVRMAYANMYEGFSDKNMQQCFEPILSYFVRTRLCFSPSKGGEWTKFIYSVFDVCLKSSQNGHTLMKNEVINFLHGSLHRVPCPTDKEVEDAIINDNNFYENKKRNFTNYILRKIEEYHNKGMITVSEGLQVDHAFAENAIRSELQKRNISIEEHEFYRHHLGNLTLLLPDENREKSNIITSAYFRDSNLWINEYLADNIDNWKPRVNVIERAEMLIDIILKIFPYPSVF